MIGKAVVLAWSIALTSINNTPQVIEVGQAPTNDNYVPFAAVVRGDVCSSIQISAGTSRNNPQDIFITNFGNTPANWSGFYWGGLAGADILTAGTPLFIQYSGNCNNEHASSETVMLDILAYPIN